MEDLDLEVIQEDLVDLVLSLLHIHLINNQKDIKWAFVLPTLQSFIDDFYQSGTDAATNLSSVKATGGDAEFTDGGYEYHVFTTPDQPFCC